MEQNESEKYVGVVKWFHDQTRDANYGFIQHAKLGDLFFHEKSISGGQDISLFRQDAIVVFNTQESKKHKGKLEAINVRFLDAESDLIFLFEQLLIILAERGEYSDYSIINQGLLHKINKLLELQVDITKIQELLDLFSTHINKIIGTEYLHDEDYLKSLLKVGGKLFPGLYNQIAQQVEENISVQMAHKLWLDGLLNKFQTNYVASIIMGEPESVRKKILANCSSTDIEELFEPFKDQVNARTHGASLEREQLVIDILEFSSAHFSPRLEEIVEIVERNITVELAHELWLKGYLANCQINHVANIIFHETQSIKQRIFDRCSDEDKLKVFFRVIYVLEHIDTDFKLATVEYLLKLSKEFVPEQHEIILVGILNICPDHYKLSLWLNDYHDILDFNAYKIFTITLNPSDQKKFVKKVLKNIHEGNLQVEIEDFTSINLMDFETSEKYAQYENAHLDYSTSVVLNVIYELHSQKKLSTLKDAKMAQHRIYDLVLKQIKDPKDILRITGYFDECEGRCTVSFRKERNEKGEEVITNVSYNRKTDDKPKNHIICDGRKFVKKDTNEPVLSEGGFEYWWCANRMCFKPSRELHSSEDWEKYTLLDFLTILKVDFVEADLELYLNIINKANRFFKHMKCRECGFILRPIKKTNYAFYGVNDFHCTNEICSQKGARIYLTHCLNGKCDHEIDSRDSVKCKPQGQDSDKCGWYVCNYCYSCCSDEGIQRRMKILSDRGQAYTCHDKGHKNRLICCNQCGNPMESRVIDQDEYKKVLQWFVNESRSKSRYVVKSGKSKTGKHWFRFAKNDLTTEVYQNKLEILSQMGFVIPNIKEKKEVQLVSESKGLNSHLFTCKFCKTTLDLTSDLEKALIIKSYHNVLFNNVVE